MMSNTLSLSESGNARELRERLSRRLTQQPIPRPTPQAHGVEARKQATQSFLAAIYYGTAPEYIDCQEVLSWMGNCKLLVQAAGGGVSELRLTPDQRYEYCLLGRGGFGDVYLGQLRDSERRRS